MARKRIKRKQLFVDTKVQGAMLWRAVVYWISAMITIASLIISWRLVTAPIHPDPTHFDDLWFTTAPALICTLVVLPIVMFDMSRLTNRFAGPLFRLRGSMRRLARGEKVEAVHFRENDYWQEIAEEFNAIVARIDRLESERQTTEPIAANSTGS